METIWLYAAIGGFIPTFFWLFFWLKQDRIHPEPKKLIALTFIFGILSAFLTIVFSTFLFEFTSLAQFLFFNIIVFAFIEEFFKYGAAYFATKKAPALNEKMDPVIYIITAALGFIAVENTLYIIDSFYNLEQINSLLEGSYRFIGASLVHIVSSAIIGISIALVFFRKKNIRRLAVFIGLILSTFFHSIFNFLILSNNEDYQKFAFYLFWFLVIIILIIFEILHQDRRIRVFKK